MSEPHYWRLRKVNDRILFRTYPISVVLLSTLPIPSCTNTVKNSDISPQQVDLSSVFSIPEQHSSRPPVVAFQADLVGDRDDLDAAIAGGLDYAEAARAELAGPIDLALGQSRIVPIKLADGRAGRLHILRLDPAADPAPLPGGSARWRCTCTIGLFGDPTAEARVLRAIGARLAELRGVDAAPLRRR